MKHSLWYINLPCACFGVITVTTTSGRKIITKTAPIAKWSLTKDIDKLKKFVEKKNGTIEKIKEYE